MRNGEPNGFMDFLKVLAVGIAAFWHGLPELTRVLLVLMAIDIAFRVGASVKTRDVAPIDIFWAVTQKVGALLLIGVAALFAPYVRIMEIDLAQAATAFYVIPQLVSITKQAAILGIPVYGQLDVILQYFRTASGQSQGASKNDSTSIPESAERPPDGDRGRNR